MGRAYRGLAGLTLGLTLAAWTPVGMAQDAQPPTREGVGKKVGERVDEVVKSIKRGARSASETLREQYARTQASIHSMGVEGRIYGRLHWDKALNGSKIDLSVDKDGVATLRGSVTDTTAKTKAVELTRDTVGVVRVKDELTVGTSTTSGTAIPAPR